MDILRTRIDGLDALLNGGIRYPHEGSAFVLLSGGAGTGKSLLALELTVRSFLEDPEQESWHFYYSVEQTAQELCDKVLLEFDAFGTGAEVEKIESPFPRKVHLRYGKSHLIITKVDTTAPADPNEARLEVSLDWVIREIENFSSTHENVHLVCIDNLSLALSQLDDRQRRRALVFLRSVLMRQKIHGLFVVESQAGHEPPGRLARGLAEQYSADVLIRLGYRVYDNYFKERYLEILKARNQYYYRGPHHFSIVGVDHEGQRLGARGERRPGIHVYPSVPAQLSMLRDASPGQLPRRGRDPLSFGIPPIDDAIRGQGGPGLVGNTASLLVVNHEYTGTVIGLHFLAAAVREGKRALYISLNEDEDAVRLICQTHEKLQVLLEGGELNRNLAIYHLRPEYITPGKFLRDIEDHIRVELPSSPRSNNRIERVVFDNIYQIRWKFPLLQNVGILVPAMIDYLRFSQVTSLFVDVVEQVKSVRPRSSRIAGMFDFAVHADRNTEDRGGFSFWVTKALGNDFDGTHRALML
ncbi:MAG: ATPase domain-containing protein [Planctomycetota bacterium]